MKHYGAIVAGVGGMGSSITYHLAKKGVKTLAVEKFGLNHRYGSSHGETRGLRTAYYEHPGYVPLVNRALELWNELQLKTKKPIVKMTGGVAIGNPKGTLVGGQLEAAKRHAFPHEVLGPKEAQDRFGAYHLAEEEVCFYTPGSGILWPENCIATHVKLAKEEGADIHFNEPLLDWKEEKENIVVRTEKGKFATEKLIFSSGAWIPQLFPQLKLPLEVERQTLFWFSPRREKKLFEPSRMPVFNWQVSDGRIFYGIPSVGKGVKVARHHGGIITTPDKVDRKVKKVDEAEVNRMVSTSFPLLNIKPVGSRVCLYTNAPDNNFIIDFHPGNANVILVSPCSGHGFKFSSVIGEVVTEMATTGKSSFDLSFLSLARFTSDRAC